MITSLFICYFLTFYSAHDADEAWRYLLCSRLWKVMPSYLAEPSSHHLYGGSVIHGSLVRCQERSFLNNSTWHVNCHQPRQISMYFKGSPCLWPDVRPSLKLFIDLKSVEWSEYAMPPSDNWNVTLDISDASVAKHAPLVAFSAVPCLVFFLNIRCQTTVHWTGSCWLLRKLSHTMCPRGLRLYFF